ncbi:MAG TPA: hypothetical protein VHD32_09905 [Candidatus Didemnitutus sp.]|nr:hypothetical protein [Candidatus Didemnitutus sp.]
MKFWTTNLSLRFGGIALVAAFSIIMLAGGHGFGPVGLLLFLGAAPEWVPGMVFGWLAVLLEILAFCSIGKKRWKPVAAVALGSFVISAALFVFFSETLRYFDLFGRYLLPFVAVAVARFVQIVLRKEKPNQSPEPTSDRGGS